MKRLLSLLLVLCLIGSMIPFQAFAAEDVDASETVVGEAPDVTDEIQEEETTEAETPETEEEEETVESGEVPVVDASATDIVRIEVDPVIVYEHADGWWEDGYWNWDDEWIEREWFEYDTIPSTVTLFFADGSSMKCAYSEVDDLTGYELDCSTDQYGIEPWGLGTHIAYAEFMGVEYEYEVIVVEDSIESFSIAPMVFMEYTHGRWYDTYWDGDLFEDVECEAWFEYDTMPDEITVHFASGRKQTYDYWDAYDEFGYDLYIQCEQEWNNTWGVGTHTVLAIWGGMSYEFEVTIKSAGSAIERVEVEPIVYREYTGGCWDGYWDEDGEWVEEAWYWYDEYPDKVTIYYADGSAETYYWEEIYDQVDDEAYCNSDQSYYNQWGGGTHTATIYILGVAYEYEIIIIERPEVVSLEIDTMYLIENTNMYTRWDEYWDEDLEDWVEYTWQYYYVYPKEFTVRYSDGSVETYNTDEAYDETGYSLRVTTDQGPDNLWDIGTHTATAEFMGMFFEYQVVIEESPVVSISADPVTKTEHYNGYWRWDEIWDSEADEWVEVEWFKYYCSPETVTICYKDGSEETLDYTEVYYETGYDIEYYTDQSAENQWGLGTHTATAEYLGVTCEYEVNIVENPVERIEVDDMTLIQYNDGWYTEDGYWDDDLEEWVEIRWFQYDIWPEYVTVYYKDGTVENIDASSEAGDYLYIDSDQYSENPWGVGTYTVYVEYMGVSCEFKVNIIENPIKRIEVAPVTIAEGTHGCIEDGYWDDMADEWVEETWFSYDPSPETVTVYYTDGTVVTYDTNEIWDLTGCDLFCRDDQDYYNQWGVGTHTATAEFMGVSCEYEVIITESPVERIEIAPETRIEYYNGWWTDDYNEYGDWIEDAWYCYYIVPKAVTVYYKDGSVETYREGDDHFDHLSCISDQKYENQWGVGTHTVTAMFMGKICEYSVTVIENPVDRIEIPDKVLMEFVDGGWSDGYWVSGSEYIEDLWFYHADHPDEVTVYYKDGSVVTYDLYELYEKTGYDLFWESEQSYFNQWGAGTYTITAEYLGKTCEYEVVILENPVDHIEISDKVMVENVDGYWYDGYWDEELGQYVESRWCYYDPKPATVTVYYKDGSVATYGGREIFEETGYGLSVNVFQDYYNQWSVGTYPLTGEYMGHRCDYNVVIVPEGGQTPLKITTQPTDYVGALKSNASFTVAVNKDDVTYQWYYSTDGVNWLKSSSTGCNTNTLTVQMLSYRLNQMYRCVITDAEGSEVASNAVKMILPESTIEIITQPADFYGAVAEVAPLTVEATGEGLTYRWYYSNNGGEGWSESWSEGYNTPTLSPVLREYNSGRMFKCLITDVNGNTEWTDVVTVSVACSDIVIKSQPVSYLGALNDLAHFTVEAEGVNLTYRWQFSTDGGETWANSENEGYSTPTLNVRLYGYRDGYMYKCIIRSGVDVQTETAAVSINKRPTTVQITSQPLNSGAPIGSEVTFQVGATGSGLNYQWQYSTDGGENWGDSGMTGAKTDALTVKVIAGRNGQMYRCAITDDSGVTVYSNVVILRVGNAPVIVGQPQSYTGAVGTMAVFTVEATGDDLTYQWQYSNNGGATWSDSGSTGCNTASLSVEAKAYRSGQMYRCIITNEIGTAISEAATLTVQ